MVRSMRTAQLSQGENNGTPYRKAYSSEDEPETPQTETTIQLCLWDEIHCSDIQETQEHL